MRTLKFHYAAAWNFLPFGPEGIELHFDKLGNIIFVKGENLDVKPIDSNLPSDEAKISSNGTGKSTLQEMLCWTIYGQTVKSPARIKVDQVVHNLIGKGCRTTVVVDNIRIERGRKPAFLRLWQSDKHEWNDSTELTQGDMRVTQKKIEELIGLSYQAFVNICIFTDDQSSCFLECDGPVKREIVENLLSLAVYRKRHETARDEQKNLKTTIATLAREYEIMVGAKTDAERRLEATIQKEKDWIHTKLEDVAKLAELVKLKTKELKTTDHGAALLAYQKAQEAIQTLTPKIAALEAKQEQRGRILSEARLKDHNAKDEARKLTEEVSEVQRVIKNYQTKIKETEDFVARINANEPGTRCGNCYAFIDESNADHACSDASKKIDSFRSSMNEELVKMKGFQEKVAVLKPKLERIKKAISDGEATIAEGDSQLRKLRAELVAASQVREPKADSAELLLQQQIEELKERAKQKKAEAEGPSPFVDILTNDRVELEKAAKLCEQKEAEVKASEKLLPYYAYWMKAYGDTGIRKWVIDGIIPALNNRIAYWLQFLIDNKITLKFDNQLNETIERNPPDGDPYVYHAMSAGQRRRINLAVSQAFAYIMATSSDRIPSLVFLDEVTTNIDIFGTIGIYNMVQELAREKQVFITTHDQEMMRMLDGCEVLELVHERGITKIKNGPK